MKKSRKSGNASLLSILLSSRSRHTRCLSDWSSDVCSSDLVRLSGCDNRLDIAARPQSEEARRLNELQFRLGRQEQQVSCGADPAAASTEPLQEAGDRRRAVDLDNPIEVADVDAKLEGRSRHDDTVAGFDERLFCSVPLVER